MPIAKPDNARTQRAARDDRRPRQRRRAAASTIVGYTQPAAGTLVLNPDQSFTYTPAPGFAGSDSFTYTVQDSVGGTAEGEVTIRVSAAEPAPVAAQRQRPR